MARLHSTDEGAGLYRSVAPEFIENGDFDGESAM